MRATSSLVWVTAADGQIADMPEWRAYTGEPVEQIKGWGWLNSLHPDDREATVAAWAVAVNGTIKRHGTATESARRRR